MTIWERTRRGYLKVPQNHEDRRFVVVGHGCIFIATLKDLCSGLEMSWLQNAILYNCAITELEMEVVSGELNGRIVNWSDNSHLRGDALTMAPAIPPLSSIHEK